MFFYYICEGNIPFCAHQCIFLQRSQGDSLQMNVLSSYVDLSVFWMPFSQQLDNPVLSASFYIYIPVLVLMHY